MNLVERWFAELTNRKLRRSAHRSVVDLETDIRKWINEWNKNPKPFVWTKTADEVGMLVGHDRRNCGDTDDRDRGRPPDHSINRCHRTPPQQKSWSGQLRLSSAPWLQVGQRGRSRRYRSA